MMAELPTNSHQIGTAVQDCVIDGEYFHKFFILLSGLQMQHTAKYVNAKWHSVRNNFGLDTVVVYLMDMKARIEQKCRAILPAQKDNLEVLHFFRTLEVPRMLLVVLDSTSFQSCTVLIQLAHLTNSLQVKVNVDLYSASSWEPHL